MKIPFERLMELVSALSEADWRMTLGQLGERWNETPERIADAITAVRVLRGERTYIHWDGGE
jgi:hypothetical protein